MNICKPLIILVALSVVSANPVYAAKKPKKPSPGIIVSSADIFSTEVRYTVPNSKKSKNTSVLCFGTSAGTAGQKSNGYTFTSFSQEQKILDYNLKYDKAYKKAKTRKKAQARLALVKALIKGSKGRCAEPDFLSLAKYRGPWGETQVRRLLTVFASGGKESWVQQYVNAGMDATINDLLTRKPDPVVDDLMFRLSCDETPDNGINNCYPFVSGSDKNDYYLEGLISAVNLRSIYTNNPVFDSLAQYVMDRHGPANPRVLGGCNSYYFKDYITDVVDRFAATGDFKRFILDTITSPLIHAKWLSGDSNHPNINGNPGNEDFFRELLELIALGVYGPNGTANYNDLDIINGSKIMSGLDETNDNGYCGVGFVPSLAATGSYTVFAGTPHQITINMGTSGSLGRRFSGIDFGQALIEVRKADIAFNLARNLWPRFINSKSTPAALKRLADVILANDLQLLPVMRAMMQSTAFYSPRSAGTILKTPFTLFVTYARQLGMPIDNYDSIRYWLDDMGMLLSRPPTVFGFSYQNQELAASTYQQARFVGLLDYTMSQNLRNLKEEYGWTPYNGLIASIPRTGDPALDMLNAMLKRLNINNSVNAEQREHYMRFLNYYLSSCQRNTHPDCFTFEGERVQLYRGAPDLGDIDDDFYRYRLLAVMLGFSDAFQVM